MIAFRSGAIAALVLSPLMMFAGPLGCARSTTPTADDAPATAATAANKRGKEIGVVKCNGCKVAGDTITFDLEDDDVDGLTDADILSVIFFGCDPEDLTFDASGSKGSSYDEETCDNTPCLQGYETFVGLSDSAVSTCDSYALTLEDSFNQDLSNVCSKSSTLVTCL